MNELLSIVRGRRPRLPRAEQLLPLGCLAAAAVLFASEFMTTFEFVPPGREALAEQAGAERHGYAIAIVAAFAFLATLVAVFAGSKPAAISVGVAGTLALLVFLVIDLPDVGAVGTLDDGRQSFFDAETVPQAGFWLALVGALSLAAGGIAMATLSAEQLAALRPRRAVTDQEPAERAATASNVPPSAPRVDGARTETDSAPEARRHRAGTPRR